MSSQNSLIIHPTAQLRRQAGQVLEHMDKIFGMAVRFGMNGKVRAADNWLLTVLPLFLTNRYFSHVSSLDGTVNRLPAHQIVYQVNAKHPGKIFGGPTKEVYSCSVAVRVKVDDAIRSISICRMPIVVGSVLCPLRNATMEDKMLAGFNPIMPLGFFIAKNIAYFTCIQERVARAKAFVYRDKGKITTVFNLVSDKSVNHHFITMFYETKSGKKATAPMMTRKGCVGDDAPSIKFSMNLVRLNASQPTPWREFNAITVAFILYLFCMKGVTDECELARCVEDNNEFDEFLSSFLTKYFASRGASAIIGHYYHDFEHDALAIAIGEASVSKDRLSVLAHFTAGETFTEDTTQVQRIGNATVEKMKKLMSCSDALFAAETPLSCLFERAFPDSPGVAKLFTFLDILLGHCITLFKCIFPTADIDDSSTVSRGSYNIRERIAEAQLSVLDNRNNLDSKDSMELDIMMGKAFFHRCHNSFSNEGEIISWSPSLSTNLDATVSKQSWKQQTSKDDTIAAVSRSSVTRAFAAAVKTSSHSSKHGGTAGNIETRMLSPDAAGYKCVHDTPHNANIGTSESIASTALSSRTHPVTFAFVLALNALDGCDSQVLQQPAIVGRFGRTKDGKFLVPKPFDHFKSVTDKDNVDFTLGMRDVISFVKVVELADGIVGPVFKALECPVEDISDCEIPVTIDGLAVLFIKKKDAVDVFLRLFKAFKHNPSFFDTVVNFNRVKGRIEIIVAGGKLMRPVITKDKLAMVIAVNKGEVDMTFEGLIVAGAITFISPIEEGMLLIADHPTHHSFDRASFVEIHTLYLYGIIAGPAPFSDCCQQSRLTLQCAMNKQAIIPAFGLDSIVETGRFGMFGSLPACVTQLSEIIGEQYNPHGSPCVTMSAATTNTYEDGLMFNEDYLSMLQYVSLRVHKFTRREKVQNLTTGLKYNGKQIYQFLEEDGMPKLGTLLAPGDVVFHGVSNVKSQESVIDESLPNGVSGFVIHKNTLDKEYYIILAEYRQPFGGDKHAFDDAQKGVITRIVPNAEMPVVVSGPHKGMRAHIFFGILSIPSRMTPGMTRQLNEGIPAILGGYRIDASPTIRDSSVTTPTKTYFVKIGKRMTVATMGIIHHVMLPHLSADKIQCVSRIRMLSDGTAARGRYRNGALRDGPMEKDAQVTHGISWSHFDGFFTRSDGCYNAICPVCKKNLNKVRPKALDMQNNTPHYECTNVDCGESVIHREDVVWLMSSAALQGLKSIFASVGIDFSFSATPLR